MYEQGTPIFKILKRVTLKLFLSLLVIYFLSFTLMYKHYDNKAKETKQQIIQHYYNEILDVILKEIKRLAAKQLINLQTSDSTIEADLRYIKICQKSKCFNYNLFKFAALIDKFIPKFIYYKIELNKKNLYANTKIQDYEVEKTYHISKYTQLTIALTIDQRFWQKEEFNIKKSFYTLSLASIISLLLFYILSQLILKYSNKLYQLYYNSKHQEILAQLNTEHQQQLKNNEVLLMEKIWNINFNRQKDIEINHLLAHAANQIAYGKQDKLNLIDQVPCSIILYQPDCQERINVNKLVNIFTDRFTEEAVNILINISSSSNVVYFSSQAALYQIIYSLISYLFFLLQQLPTAVQYQINLSIEIIEKRLKLYFTYSGTPINSEEELFSLSNKYFKTHANPFLLTINQIFSILRTNGFNCKVSSSKFNIIEITEKEPEYKSTHDNVVTISSRIKQ